MAYKRAAAAPNPTAAAGKRSLIAVRRTASESGINSVATATPETESWYRSELRERGIQRVVADCAEDLGDAEHRPEYRCSSESESSGMVVVGVSQRNYTTKGGACETEPDGAAVDDRRGKRPRG